MQVQSTGEQKLFDLMMAGVSSTKPTVSNESEFSKIAADMLQRAVSSQPKDANNGLPKGMDQKTYETAMDMVKLANDAHSVVDKMQVDALYASFTGISDVRNVDLKVPDNYQVIDKGGSLIDLGFESGLDYTVYENKDTGDRVLAFRGTEPLSIKDIIQDFQQAVGKSQQYEEGIALARKMSAELKQENAENGTDKKLTFTGVSLGGGLATAAALATGDEAYAISAVGLSESTIEKHGLDVNNADKVTNFNTVGDFSIDHNNKQDSSTLFSGQFGLEETHQYGKAYWMEGVSEKADFLGWLVPDIGLGNFLKRVANHLPPATLYGLENKAFYEKNE